MQTITSRASRGYFTGVIEGETIFQTMSNFLNFSSQFSITAFNINNDNVIYSIGCLVHDQENHHLCFIRLLWQIVCNKKLKKSEKNLL